MIPYQDSNQRAFANTLKTLQTTQKERLAQEAKFVSKPQGFAIFPRYDKTGHPIPGEYGIYPNPAELAEYYGQPKKAV